MAAPDGSTRGGASGGLADGSTRGGGGGLADGSTRGGGGPRAGFLALAEPGSLRADRRRRVNKNRKKSWKKHSRIGPVEEFLEDVRLQERTVGGLISDKTDESLFFVDTGDEKKDVKLNKGKVKPLRIDLILQPDSKVPAPKDILSHQVPNSRKMRQIARREEKLKGQGILPRKERLLQARLQKRLGKAMPPAPSGIPGRDYYDIWSESSLLEEDLVGKDPWYLKQTKKLRVKRPDRLNKKPSLLPAIEVVAPGGSYNPTFQAHQDLLLKAHEAEVKKLREEERLKKQLSFPAQEEAPTEESKFKELCEGLVEESDGEEEAEDSGAGQEPESLKEPSVLQAGAVEKKTEKQRKREREAKEQELKLRAEKEARRKQQELFRLRSIKLQLKREEEKTAQRKRKREEKRKAEEAKPKRLGRLKYQDPDLDIQLSDEIAGSLRRLKPEGSILKDRFKSLQKRNLIESRERAKFKRKYRLKYVEKRAFREIK
ncbi:ribosome biogenesis protein NOP53 isoform X2 [Latimeria chalumnae]